MPKWVITRQPSVQAGVARSLRSSASWQQGLGNKEIAGQLDVSESAVKKRISRLMRLLCAENRVTLVRVALATGLIGQGEDPDRKATV